MELDYHQDRADRADDDDEGPQELADPSPDVRSLEEKRQILMPHTLELQNPTYIGKREHVNDGDSSNTQANTTVNVPTQAQTLELAAELHPSPYSVPFRISEEHILTVN